MFQSSGLSLLAGDTIDLALGTGGDGYNSDNTPVNLVITLLPEPATTAFAAVACAVFVTCRRRRRASLRSITDSRR